MAPFRPERLARDIDVPEAGGLVVTLDDFTDARGGHVLLRVLAAASRRRPLFGRIFAVLVRVDDSHYEGPTIGAMRPWWNRREWTRRERGG